MSPDGLSTATSTPAWQGAGPDHVVILLALFNGAAQLREQLDSLATRPTALGR